MSNSSQASPDSMSSSSRRSNTADDILLGQKSEVGIVIRSSEKQQSHSFNPYASRKSFKRISSNMNSNSSTLSSSQTQQELERPKYGIIYVYLCTGIACLSSILLGYDIGK